ncbi:hypothetical protein LZ32DRAFT_593845 [Colletotrichum eremochloae]|nr:hypothetical protein LZ32DRAFT_593845 [Colletotrichum eremochloae]
MTSTLLKQGKKLATKAAQEALKEARGERDKSRKNQQANLIKKNDPVDALIRVAASAVGLVSEIAQYKQEKKVSEDIVVAEDPYSPNQTTTSAQINEDIWRQDEAGRETEVRETETKSPKEPSDLANAFLRRHPHHSSVMENVTIQLPVVIPQRRPKKRARGFVRAYSPVLADAGIDRNTFLDFIDTFNQALEPNPYLYAINLAGLAGMATPEPFVLLVGIAVAFATDAVMETQSRSKSAKFLDRINAEFFVPRGLVCLVATWKPDASEDEKLLTAVDFDGKTVEKPPKMGLAQQMRDVVTQKVSSEEIMKGFQKEICGRMKASSGAFQWPNPAPLIFPSPEETSEAMITKRDGTKKNKIDRGEIWLDDFMDKRAQAKWIHGNPDSTMAVSLPRPQFRSRYADPSHAAASGDIVAFFTGGRWSTKGKVTSEVHGGMPDFQPQGEVRVPAPKGKESKDKPIQKNKDKSSKSSSSGFMSLLQKDVLYLIIVNIPSPADSMASGISIS